MASKLLKALVKYKRLVEWCEEELWQPCQAYHNDGHALSISYFDEHLFGFLVREGLELSPLQFHVPKERIDSDLKYHHIPYVAIETTLFDGRGHDSRDIIASYDRVRQLARELEAPEACFVVFNLWQDGRLRFGETTKEIFTLSQEGLRVQIVVVQVAPAPWPADIAENIEFRLNEDSDLEMLPADDRQFAALWSVLESSERVHQQRDNC